MTNTEADHERWQRQERRNHVPDNEAAGAVALDAVLGRTPSLVVVMLAARVFSTGIELELMVRLRRVGEAPNSPLHHHLRGPVGDDGVDDVMELAVEYPDGRRVVGRRGGWDDEDEETPVLRMMDGSGTNTTRDHRYWLAPLRRWRGDHRVLLALPRDAGNPDRHLRGHPGRCPAAGCGAVALPARAGTGVVDTGLAEAGHAPVASWAGPTSAQAICWPSNVTSGGSPIS